MPDKNMTRITLPGRDRDADLYKLTRAWVDALEWEDAEYGAWNVNGKRPFGNSGKDGVAEDILEILGFTADEKCPTCHAVVTDRSKLHAYAHDLFRDIPKMLARLTPAPRPHPTHDPLPRQALRHPRGHLRGTPRRAAPEARHPHQAD